MTIKKAMGRTTVITQPNYLPWLGYFEQIARADVLVFLDTVQYEKQEWQNRNRLKGTNGRPFWLTVPVEAHPLSTRLMDIRISSHQGQWRRKHLRSIETALGATPFFGLLFPLLQQWIEGDYEYLVELNTDGIKLISRLLGLSPLFIRASELRPEGEKSRLVLSLCQQVNTDRYYSSAGAKAYLDEDLHLFSEAGIQVTYQSWQHPIYTQPGESFISHLSAVDALMNIGPEATRSFILGNGLATTEQDIVLSSVA
jgi:hypothetical protein